VFAKHHYLSHSHNNAAHVFVAFINGELAGFLSVLHFPHPSAKNIKKVHRLVILPDYQGAGFGIRFLNEIGYIYRKEGFRYFIMTSAPSLINALKLRKQWACKRYGRVTEAAKGVLQGSTSKQRITASFELR
jgi:GNAT superfamily N-acetyltransferase